MNLDWVEAAVRISKPIHHDYFHVRSHGTENIPRRGRAILAGNHSGIVAIDGSMIWVSVFEHTDPPRVARPIGDHFISSLPFVSSIFARLGVVNGTRRNAERLLEDEELLLIFPEGASAIAKPKEKHYHLGSWHVGHAELAIRYRAPVVPIAVIGAEEQWPLLVRLQGVRLFGAPFLPIPATPIPLPVPIDIYYGAPLVLGTTAEDADDPQVVAQAATRVRDEVQRMIDEGLKARREVRS